MPREKKKRTTGETYEELRRCLEYLATHGNRMRYGYYRKQNGGALGLEAFLWDNGPSGRGLHQRDGKARDGGKRVLGPETGEKKGRDRCDDDTMMAEGD